MADPSLYFITAMLYAALGLQAMTAPWTARTVPQAGLAAESGHASAISWQRFALPVALVLHAFILYRAMLGHGQLDLSLGIAVSLIVWVTGVIYWVGSFKIELGVLRTYILLIAAVSVVAPYFLPSGKTVAYGRMAAFQIHIVIALLAYGLFTIAALHAALLAIVERRLRSGSLPPIMQNLPPLMAMEALLFRMLWAGFGLLTLTLVSGIFFSEALFDRPFAFNHKNVLTLVAWVVFAGLLAGRHLYGWRGRTAVRWTMTGFAILLLAYVGTKVVLELILHRT